MIVTGLTNMICHVDYLFTKSKQHTEYIPARMVWTKTSMASISGICKQRVVYKTQIT